MVDEVTPIEEATKDKGVVLFIIGSLAVCLFIVVGGAIVLPFFGKEMPIELSPIISMIIGGFLAALRLPTGSK